MIKTIEWTDDGVRMIDQRKLPTIEEYPVFKTYEEVADAIRVMVVRGAPAIGVAAAMGVALGMRDSTASFEEISKTLAATRPTAVNLFWAIERMKSVFNEASAHGIDRKAIAERLILEAIADPGGRHREQHADGRLRPGPAAEFRNDPDALQRRGARHCFYYGTALGVIRAAVENGKRIKVIADETRPFLQGARLTAWELWKDDIDVRVISDNMAGSFMHQGLVDAVIVGADRIAANGDVANKIGTYSVAVLARQHQIPFYVAAPISTLDLTIPDGSHIPIEQREAAEVTHHGGTRMVPEGVSVFNPAFDVTPNEFVTAIITERGVAKAAIYAEPASAG